MSTKIYTGFAFTGVTLETSLMLLGRQQEAIQALVDTKNAKAMAAYCATKIDDFCQDIGPVGPPPEEETNNLKISAFGLARQHFFKAQLKNRRTLLRDPFIDCDVLIRLFGDFETGKIVGYVCEEKVGVLKHLLSVPGIIPFAYWNNVDPDEDVSEADWEARGELWDRVLTSGKGFEFNMAWEPSFVTSEAVEGFLPNRETRIERLSRTKTIDSYVAANWTRPESGHYTGMLAVFEKGEGLLTDPTSELFSQREKCRQHLTNCLVPDLAFYLRTPLGELPLITPPLKKKPKTKGLGLKEKKL